LSNVSLTPELIIGQGKVGMQASALGH